MDPQLIPIQNKAVSIIDHLKLELSGIRAGRANPSMVENIPVSAYGSVMKMVELGTISAPQPSLITISVWDGGLVTEVLKAIQEANLGINPSNEGNVVRLPIPPLTAERREEYKKLASSKAEDAKISIRQLRQDARHDWEKLESAGEIGQDELERREKLLQNLIDQLIAEVGNLLDSKVSELSTL